MSKNNNPNNFSNNQGFNTINSQNLSRMNLPNQNSNNNSYRNYFSGNNQFFSQGTNNIYPVNEINNNLNMMQNMMFNYNCLWWNNNMNMLNTANQYMCLNNINFNNFPNVMDNDVNPLNINTNNEYQNFINIEENKNSKNKQLNDSTEHNQNLRNENSNEKQKTVNSEKKNKEINQKDNEFEESSLIVSNNQYLIDYKDYINVCKEKNINKSKFNDIKDEIKDIVENIVIKFLENKKYEKEQAQLWCDNINNEILKILYQQKRGFKFICTTTLFEKGNASFNINSLFDKIKDGSITFKYEKDKIHCFVCLFGIASI